MTRRIARLLATWSLLAGAAPAQQDTAAIERGYDVYTRPGRLVRLDDGHRLNLRCGGAGAVTVLLEAGLGYPSYSWRKVQPALERVTRTCSYDRAGLGFSDPGPLPRSAGRLADDLAALVRHAGLRPPFILVASSMGSQPARLFAFRHPDQVRGMVLVDPYVEGQNAAFATIAPEPSTAVATRRAAEARCDRLLAAQRLTAFEAERRECIDTPDAAFSPRLRAVTRRQRLSPAMARAVASERDALEATSDVEVRREQRALGSMPLVVLTAGDDFRGEPREVELMAALRRLHRQVAALSARGEERLVPGAGHVIQSSRPDVVIAAVREVLAGASTSDDQQPYSQVAPAEATAP